MPLRKSGEDYLEAILVLKKKKGMVRSADVARHLKVSKPSVCHAVATLKKGGFLLMDGDHFLHLTDLGREVAEDTYEKHLFFTEILVAAGVDPVTAERDACRIEHVVSKETFERLKATRKLSGKAVIAGFWHTFDEAAIGLLQSPLKQTLKCVEYPPIGKRRAQGQQAAASGAFLWAVQNGPDQSTLQSAFHVLVHPHMGRTVQIVERPGTVSLRGDAFEKQDMSAWQLPPQAAAIALSLAVAIPLVAPDGQFVVPFPSVFLSGAFQRFSPGLQAQNKVGLVRPVYIFLSVVHG